MSIPVQKRVLWALAIYFVLVVFGVGIARAFAQENTPPSPILIILGPSVGFLELEERTLAVAVVCNLLVLPFFVAAYARSSWIAGVITVMLWLGAGFVCYSMNAI
jgi:hypothetical protein